MDIVFVIDKRYFTYLNVTIYSILKNNPHQHITFWIIKNSDFDIQNKLIENLRNEFSFEICFVNSPLETDVYENLYRPTHISTAAFNKFKIPRLLPQNIKKVLYLDCDIIVTDKIDNLFNVDLETYYLAAVLDGDENYAKKVGLPAEKYFT